MIPFLDLAPLHENIFGELQDSLRETIINDRFILGNAVKNFEDNFAAYCGTKYAIGVNSGLDALTITLRAYDIGTGDEVIVTANTFIATWFSITSCGAQIVPIEPNIKSYNIKLI